MTRPNRRLLNNNRHATCVDCHDSHASLAVTSFTSPATAVNSRVASRVLLGISATDGTTDSESRRESVRELLAVPWHRAAGKQSLAVFGYLPTWAVAAGGSAKHHSPDSPPTATSSHPVLHDRSSSLAQPSLLSYMWNLNGKTQGRAMGIADSLYRLS
jgi:hypothetical protein